MIFVLVIVVTVETITIIVWGKCNGYWPNPSFVDAGNVLAEMEPPKCP